MELIFGRVCVRRSELDWAKPCWKGSAMSAELIAQLPTVQRLALSYAPARARAKLLTLLTLDNRLADILRGRGEEPIMAQMKLAWWRDRLRDDPANWPKGEPLLARLAEWGKTSQQLAPLVDGWEVLLAEELDAAALDEYAAGRALAWRALHLEQGGAADLGQIEQAAREWALADLALHMGQGEEAERVRGTALALPWGAITLPRTLRPLLVLRGLAQRALHRGERELLDSPSAGLLALRLGLIGR